MKHIFFVLGCHHTMDRAVSGTTTHRRTRARSPSMGIYGTVPWIHPLDHDHPKPWVSTLLELFRCATLSTVLGGSAPTLTVSTALMSWTEFAGVQRKLARYTGALEPRCPSGAWPLLRLPVSLV